MYPVESSSVPWRGAFAAALTLAMVAITPRAYLASPMVKVDSIPVVPVEAVLNLVDVRWHHADYLAWVISQRRYADIEAAAAEVDRESPYARWVPAAIGLAVEQLDTSAAAYARMGMCSELRAFLRRVGDAWPRGRAAMHPVACHTFACGTAKSDMVKAFGGIAAYRQVQRVLQTSRYAERVAEIEGAALAGDHFRALARCGELRHDGPMPAACLVEACRARDIAAAEVLRERVRDAAAEEACEQVGVRFVAGIAHASAPWSPVDLVRVHPDAPPILAANAIIDW